MLGSRSSPWAAVETTETPRQATATAEWAEDYCAAITDWATELEDWRPISSGILRSLSQEGFEQAGTDIRSATEDFTGELRALGAPDTESGEEARQAVETFATAAEAELAAIEEAVDNVSAAGRSRRRSSPITASLTSMNEAFMTMVESLRKIDPKEELQAALEGRRVLRRPRRRGPSARTRAARRGSGEPAGSRPSPPPPLKQPA